jgi:hypothetical protein
MINKRRSKSQDDLLRTAKSDRMCDKSIPDRGSGSLSLLRMHSPLESHPLDSTFQLVVEISKHYDAIQGRHTLCATSKTLIHILSF